MIICRPGESQSQATSYQSIKFGNAGYSFTVDHSNNRWKTGEENLIQMSNQARHNYDRRAFQPRSDFRDSREQQIRVLPYNNHQLRTTTYNSLSFTAKPKTQSELSSQLKNHLNQISPDSLKSNDNFVNFLNYSNVTAEVYEKFLKISSKEDFVGASDSTLDAFVQNAKHVYVKNTLNGLDNARAEENYDKLYNINAIDDITAAMIFNEKDLLQFIKSKLNIREDQITEKEKVQNFTSFLNKKFPSSSELNQKLVKYMNEHRASMSLNFDELGKNADKFLSIKSRHMTNFFNINKNDEIMKSLSRIDERNAERNLADLKRANALNDVTLEMLFNPEKLTEFLNEKLSFCARKVFDKLLLFVLPLNDMRYIWGRTPEKCIIYEICNRTSISNWRDDTVDKKISNYQQPVIKTINEVDETFFELVRNDMTEIDQNEIDNDCFIAFIKRNNSLKKMYHAQMLSDYAQRDKFIKIAIKDYREKYLT